MNYIKKLQSDLAEAEGALAEIDDDVRELLAYVQSDKFQGDHELAGYVNISDVIARLSPVLANTVQGSK